MIQQMRTCSFLWMTVVPIVLFAVAEPTLAKEKPQSSCPLMGGSIGARDMYVDVKGKRIYICCAACEDAIRHDPDKYIKIIEKRGEVVEDAPPAENQQKR